MRACLVHAAGKQRIANLEFEAFEPCPLPSLQIYWQIIDELMNK